MYECDNCGKRYEREDELARVFPDIPDLLERLDVGGTVPAGECPHCGALVYLRKDDESKPIMLAALEHAYRRLNAIPHRYADTDFRLICDGIAEARKPARLLT